jgi:hypothetical protein
MNNLYVYVVQYKLFLIKNACLKRYYTKLFNLEIKWGTLSLICTKIRL